MCLYQLCYRSRIRPDALVRPIETEIARTTKRLRRLNALNGITGALILTDEHVFQLIEGYPEAIEDALHCAELDARHTDLEILSRKVVEYRLFHDAWLHFADLRLESDHDLPANIETVMPDPATASADDVLSLMAFVASDLNEASLTRRLLLT